MQAYQHLKILERQIYQQYEEAVSARNAATWEGSRPSAAYDQQSGEALALAGVLGAVRFILNNADEAQ